MPSVEFGKVITDSSQAINTNVKQKMFPPQEIPHVTEMKYKEMYQDITLI